MTGSHFGAFYANRKEISLATPGDYRHESWFKKSRVATSRGLGCTCVCACVCKYNLADLCERVPCDVPTHKVIPLILKFLVLGESVVYTNTKFLKFTQEGA